MIEQDGNGRTENGISLPVIGGEGGGSTGHVEGDRIEPVSDQSQMMERGVENPEIIDLIRHDQDAGEVVFHIVERRPWGSDPKQLGQFDEKLNRYLTYILNGFLGRHYPDFQGMPTRIRIECIEEPTDERVIRFLEGVGMVCEQNGVGFEVVVTERGEGGE